MSSVQDFISPDGYLCIEEFTALAREIDKCAIGEQLKANEIHFVPKVMPKYDKAKVKKDPAAFERKRALIVKTKKRMPPAGSRMKMVIVLRLYKGLEDAGFDQDIANALKAIAKHNVLAEKTVTAYKKGAAKKREVLTREFDKNLAVVDKLLAEAGIKKVNIALGQSMMGKTMVVKLPNGGYISIGKADEEKFLKAKAPKEESAGGFGRRAKPTVEDQPVKKSRKTAPTPTKGSKIPTKSRR